jgi:hypothetical protein
MDSCMDFGMRQWRVGEIGAFFGGREHGDARRELKRCAWELPGGYEEIDD